MRIAYKVTVVIVLILSIVGCAGAQIEKVRNYLDSNMNKMTYDKAIMQWGPPTSVAEGENIFVATWLYSQTSGAITAPVGTMYLLTMPISHGWKLELTFDKKTNRMIYWKYNQW